MLQPKLLKSMRRPDFSLLVMDVLLLMKRSLLLKPTKLWFLGTFSPMDFDFLVISFAFHSGEVFREDASIDSELFPGTFKNFLDNEDFQMYYWC
jgi:hypothetical protein